MNSVFTMKIKREFLSFRQKKTVTILGSLKKSMNQMIIFMHVTQVTPRLPLVEQVHRSNKCYQTPYGEVEIERYIYQAAVGGTTFCPLEMVGTIALYDGNGERQHTTYIAAAPE
jgi:hypothetical protein